MSDSERKRPEHLPRGLRGLIVENVIWIVLVLGAAAGWLIARNADWIFGG